jgi:ubiquinol oxidase
MTFLKPSLFQRVMILGAQGVFYNLFCRSNLHLRRIVFNFSVVMAYMVSPRTCHRFVGHLEEEAVLT